MKKIVLLIVCFVLLIGIEEGWAQKVELALPSKLSVLIDDTHAESQKLAKEYMNRRHASAFSVLKDLTVKQKMGIVRIEAERDKTLMQINDQIALEMDCLITLQSFNSEDQKLTDKTIDKISKLSIARQKAEALAKQKIRLQLTKKQRNIFDNIK